MYMAVRLKPWCEPRFMQQNLHEEIMFLAFFPHAADPARILSTKLHTAFTLLLKHDSFSHCKEKTVPRSFRENSDYNGFCFISAYFYCQNSNKLWPFWRSLDTFFLKFQTEVFLGGWYWAPYRTRFEIVRVLVVFFSAKIVSPQLIRKKKHTCKVHRSLKLHTYILRPEWVHESEVVMSWWRHRGVKLQWFNNENKFVISKSSVLKTQNDLRIIYSPSYSTITVWHFCLCAWPCTRSRSGRNRKLKFWVLFINISKTACSNVM